MLAGRARTNGAKVAFRFLRADEKIETITYEDLERQAACIAGRLGRGGVAAGDRVLVAAPPGLGYVAAFFGCLYAGAIAVPAYPPRGSHHDERFDAIVRDCAAATALTTQERAGRLRRQGGLRWVTVEEAIAEGERGDRAAGPGEPPDRPAFLQYTSGSTAMPRGVVVPHRAAMANLGLIAANFDLTPGDLGVSWLPPYHDMGLIGGILAPIFAGIECVLLAPADFAREPGRWLRAVSETGATVSGGPDFAYRLCAERVPAHQCEGLDLRRWRVAFSGAEPIRAATLRQFADRFGANGFDERAWHPCYGLAEATLLVSGARAGSPPTVCTVDQAELAAHRVRPAADGAPLVSCGEALVPLLIVDPATGRPAADGVVGEIWLRGESIAAGYWGQADLTAETFQARLAPGTGTGGRWLRTGDLGFLRSGELVVTGRAKDLIIIRGRNIYPQDVEDLATRADPALHGQAAAFSVTAADGHERLAIAVEADRHASPATLAEAAGAVRAAVATGCGVAPSAVTLVRRAALPRTSSGKVRRAETARRWAAGELATIFETHAGGPSGTPAHGGADPAGEGVIEALRRCAAAVLETDPGGIRDDRPLVQQGLDSLGAAQFVGAAEQAGLAVPLDGVLDGGSLADLAPLARAIAPGPAAVRADTTRTRLVGGEPGAGQQVEGGEPARAGQRALWLHERLVPGTPAYTMAAAWRLPSTVDERRLDVALLAVLARHRALRSRFTGDEPRVVTDPVPDRLLEIAPPVPAAELGARLRELSSAPFDLKQGRLVRAVLLPVPDDEAVLLLTAHHAVVDLQALDVVAADLERAYEQGGLAIDAEPLAVVAGNGPAATATVPAETARSWWREHLRGASGTAHLLADRPPPRNPTHRGRTLRRHHDADLAGLARDCATTPYTALLAAAAILVARVGTGTDAVLGVPVASTPRAVGYGVTVLPVRIDVAAARTVRQVVKLTRSALAGALAHASIDADELLRLAAKAAGAGAREPGRHPLIDILVVDETARATGSGRLLRSRVPVDRAGAAADLSILLDFPRGAGSGFYSGWEYARDRFDPDTVERLTARFDALLGSMLEGPDRDWRDLRLVGAAEVDRLLEWGRPPSAPPLPGRGLLHEAVWSQADARPDAPAVVALRAGPDGAWSEATTLTYAELRAAATRVSTMLTGRAIGRGDRVALLMPRGPAFVAAMLGTLACGAAYVPLDPSYPAGRVAATLRDAAVAAELAEEPVLALLAGAAAPVSGVSSDMDGGTARPDDPAYVIYTSGSTGSPKGVVVSHRNACASTAARLAYYGDPVGRFLLLSSPAFDSSVAGIYWTLSTGGTLLLPPAATEADPVATWRAIRAAEVTHTLTLPSLYAAMCEVASTVGEANALRTVVVAGEVCRRDMVQRHPQAAPGADLVNEYGPTEATVWATAHRVGQDEQPLVPIGRPVPGVAAYVCDGRGALAGVGVPGELRLGGAQVALGYHGRDDQERFLSGPFGRLYATGDLVSWAADGTLRFHGRLDDQVKIRGHRVEPAEVEAVLAGHPRVAGCAVTARPDGHGRARLVAYITTADPDPGTERDGGAERETGPGADGVRAWLASRLPPAAIPEVVLRLSELPRRPNGKVDRRALPDPPGPAGGQGRPPCGEYEAAVAAAYAAAIGVTRVGADDDFFALGGHSLAAVQVAARLTAALRSPVGVRDVFTAPTPERLGALLAGRAAPEGTSAAGAPEPDVLPPIRRQPRRATTDPEPAT